MSERSPLTGTNAAPDASSAQSTDATNPSRSTVALAAFALATAQDEIAAEAPDADGPEPPTSSTSKAPRSGREHARADRTPRRTIVRPRRAYTTLASPPATQAPQGAATTEQTPDTQAELRNWIKDNAALLSNASLLISISALALNLLPTAGFLDPYIKALIFGAALLLLLEMHHQWPADLQIHRVTRSAPLDGHSWRMVGFAFLMQAATIVFAVWATLTNPLILVPLTAIAVVLAFRQWYFRRFRGGVARGLGVVALIAVLLLSELFMVIIWALISGEQVTIELWTDERPGLTLETTPDA